MYWISFAMAFIVKIVLRVDHAVNNIIVCFTSTLTFRMQATSTHQILHWMRFFVTVRNCYSLNLFGPSDKPRTFAHSLCRINCCITFKKCLQYILNVEGDTSITMYLFRCTSAPDPAQKRYRHCSKLCLNLAVSKYGSYHLYNSPLVRPKQCGINRDNEYFQSNFIILH